MRKVVFDISNESLRATYWYPLEIQAFMYNAPVKPAVFRQMCDSFCSTIGSERVNLATLKNSDRGKG